MELSAADPVPTSVRFYLAALLSNSAGREICRCFFFFLLSSPQTDASSLSRARQQTDGRVRCMKRGKRFVQAQAVRLGERRVLGEVFKQSGKNKPVVFVSPSQREWVTWGRRWGGERRTKRQIYDILHDPNTQTHVLNVHFIRRVFVQVLQEKWQILLSVPCETAIYFFICCPSVLRRRLCLCWHESTAVPFQCYVKLIYVLCRRDLRKLAC